MCGIVGYIGDRPALEVLANGLRRLEYRGYDSTGIAYFRDGKIEIQKSEGKLERVEKLLSGIASDPSVTCGIGHTRWATHGKPTTQNAHPHRVSHVVLVHNGIIENYQDIKENLLKKGLKPVSETDSELFGFLVMEEMERGLGLVEAVRKSFSRIEGSCSVVVMSEKEPGLIVGVRNGSPLVAAIDPEGGAILASDAQPLLEITRDVFFLENGDVAVATRKGVEFFDVESGKEVSRQATRLDWSVDQLDKQGFPHYMLKEIREQPVAMVDTLNGLLDRAKADPFPFSKELPIDVLEAAAEIVLVACGTSWHAALLGKYWFERWARIPVQVELASEFRYRKPVLRAGTVVLGISQSGETADTLAVIRDVKKMGFPALAITNVRGSTIAREADGVFFTSAGPEIGVAATKTFTTQLLTLLLMAGDIARKKSSGEGDREIRKLFDGIVRLPHVLENDLGHFTETVRSVALSLQDAKGFFFMGRGYSFPIALEGALKLKEIAYVHAEGYAAGEALKHGPIAMIDEKMVVVVLAPSDSWREKTASNLEEVKARGAKIVGVGDELDKKLISLCDHWISIPKEMQAFDESLFPFALTAVVQLLSYELAVAKGTNVDKPRNLAKSVTVE